MGEPLSSDDDFAEEPISDVPIERVNDPAMTLLVFGLMAVLAILIVAILIADRRPPAGL